jgi:hypothetical protein
MKGFGAKRAGSLIAVFLWGGVALAAPESSSVTGVKYRSGKEIRFDELLIQGQMKRAEVSVVTGDQAEFSNGLLRLRENFLDHAANDLGEEIQQ